MSTSTIAKATRVERAMERLEAAVDRLDLALSTGAGGVSSDEDIAALDHLRGENAELRDLNRAAADRLGGAILRLQGLLADESGA